MRTTRDPLAVRDSLGVYMHLDGSSKAPLSDPSNRALEPAGDSIYSGVGERYSQQPRARYGRRAALSQSPTLDLGPAHPTNTIPPFGVDAVSPRASNESDRQHLARHPQHDLQRILFNENQIPPHHDSSDSFSTGAAAASSSFSSSSYSNATSVAFKPHQPPKASLIRFTEHMKDPNHLSLYEESKRDPRKRKVPDPEPQQQLLSRPQGNLKKILFQDSTTHQSEMTRPHYQHDLSKYLFTVEDWQRAHGMRS